MAYKALYRKYRPNTFEEVVGQQHIVVTLLNAIKTDKIAHAYLFCGPRGTGKTSIAKLLAKTLNCTCEGQKPCGKCTSCLDIQESTHPDVVELDAATYNGVDEIREIIDKVKYAPMNGKYKVYIIDEVHMMTTSAFNALLKTLEEPPEYCIFILATTEPHKVLPTIISRCQRFDFNKVADNLIVTRLKDIVSQEKINVDDDALRLIASIADGGMRDALSVLDQCIAYAQDNITVQDVGAVYGITTVQEKLDIFKAVAQKDAAGITTIINSLSEKGVDIKRLTIDLINLAKEGAVYELSKDASMLSIMKQQQANELAKMFSSTQLLQYIDYLMDTQSKYRDATDVTAYLQICLLKMIDYKQSEPISIEKVIQPVVEEKKEIVKENKPVKKEIKMKSLDDEEIYNILKVSSKALRESDEEKWQKLLTSQENPFIINQLKETTVMAESENDLILTCKDASVANNINDLENNASVETIVEKYYGIHKNVICITSDYREYIIHYFTNHKNIVKPQPTNNEEKLERTAPLENLIQLFGEDGFDQVGDK